MKKIIFNATILNDRPTGLGVYTNKVIEKIEDIFDEVVYTDNLSRFPRERFARSQTKIKCKNKRNIVSVFLRNINFQKYVGGLERKEETLIYSPTQHLVKDEKINQIITVHDLMPLLYPKGRIQQYIYYRFVLKRNIKKCNKIITVSKNTKYDIMRFYGIQEEKIAVIYNGVDLPEKIDIDNSKRIIENKYKVKDYILMVGINYEYKNLHRVIQAYRDIKDEIGKKLVIVGNYNVSYGKELMKLVSEYSLNEEVIFLGYIDEEDKNFIYQAADVFVYPSMYEGFGMPVLEAMSNSVPVICSNTSSLPEVGGDAAFYIDPNDISNIKTSIKKVLMLSDGEKADIINKGLSRAKQFSWDKCSQEIKQIITDVCEISWGSEHE